MTPTTLRTGTAFTFACLILVSSFQPSVLSADPNPLATAPRPTPEVTADGNPNDDVEQQPAVLGQWNDTGSTRNSLDKIVKTLSEDDKGNQVERKTVHYAGDGRASQETTVRSNLPGKRMLSDVKRGWSPTGDLVYVFRQTNTLNADGIQVGGERDTLNLTQNQITREKMEHWNSGFKGWLVASIRTNTYYSDGDMKQRTTEQPSLNKKTKETWGSRGLKGREKTTLLWNETAHLWIAPPLSPVPPPAQ